MSDAPDPHAALDYHERTKHHFQRFARSLGHLDWATQPAPFREFIGAERVPLDLAVAESAVDFDDLFEPGSVEPVPLTAAALSDFLRHSLALSAWKQAGPSRWALRVNPSSGNLHPTEGYVLLPTLEGVAETPGVHHYRPQDHSLERRARVDPEAFAVLTAGLPEGSFLVGLTSIHWREAWKYGERAFRYCQHDLGHALAALSLAAALSGWRFRALLGWPHAVGERLLGLDRESEFPVEQERDEFEVLAVVSSAPVDADPAPPGGALLERWATSAWTGEANVLSEDHVDWEVIDTVAAATRNPGSRLVVGSVAAPPRPGDRPARDARTILTQRRSAVMFDNASSISRDGFLRILHRTLPAAAPPWDALPIAPAIHLFLFVHRVEGLEPGLYFLVRDPGALDRLRVATRDQFAWARPDGVDDAFPLYHLLEGDARAHAARLSCTQDIAGASFFSLGMIADFERTIAEHGSAAYRRLFWEAGMVGQVLYLEAEAEAARGTGIGCYFDDPVHETLGLTGREFQSLYHFTVGIPVEDDRLTTLPPYDAE